MSAYEYEAANVVAPLEGRQDYWAVTTTHSEHALASGWTNTWVTLLADGCDVFFFFGVTGDEVDSGAVSSGDTLGWKLADGSTMHVRVPGNVTHCIVETNTGSGALRAYKSSQNASG